MSNANKVILSCVPFLLAGVIALCMPLFQQRKEARTMDRLETLPMGTAARIGSHTVDLGHHIFSEGGYGVYEIGNVRLAFEGWSFSNNGSGSLSYPKDPGVTALSKGRSLVGGRVVRDEGMPGGVRCGFGKLVIEIVQGKAMVDGHVIDFTGPPVLVLIDRSDKVRAVKPLKPGTP